MASPSGTGHDTARAYPTEFVECDRCDGDGEIEGEDFFCCPRCCWQCGGTGAIEVCASCDPAIQLPQDDNVLADGRSLREHLEEWRNAPSNTASGAAGEGDT